jgi:hypothetical protein
MEKIIIYTNIYFIDLFLLIYIYLFIYIIYTLK